MVELLLVHGLQLDVLGHCQLVHQELENWTQSPHSEAGVGAADVSQGRTPLRTTRTTGTGIGPACPPTCPPRPGPPEGSTGPKGLHQAEEAAAEEILANQETLEDLPENRKIKNENSLSLTGLTMRGDSGTPWSRCCPPPPPSMGELPGSLPWRARELVPPAACPSQPSCAVRAWNYAAIEYWKINLVQRQYNGLKWA